MWCRGGECGWQIDRTDARIGHADNERTHANEMAKVTKHCCNCHRWAHCDTFRWQQKNEIKRNSLLTLGTPPARISLT